MGRSRSKSRSRGRSRDRGRSPPRYRSSPRGGGGRGGGSFADRNSDRVSLLVRNLDLSVPSIAEELRRVFEKYGLVKDVYIPLDFHTKKPKPFAFIEFINYDDARDAKESMDRRDFNGRQIDVVFAQERRKTPDQMKVRDGPLPPRGYSRSPRRHSRSPRRDDRRNDSPRRGRDDSRGRRGSSSPRRDDDYRR